DHWHKGNRGTTNSRIHLPITGATPGFLSGEKFWIQELWFGAQNLCWKTRRSPAEKEGAAGSSMYFDSH
ncbi:MAG TPA: hypothetical protein VJV96_19470, partial [Candidatus Angelobacter sp.]|nr:hypothetical protein [Candidatus Angelobacter sp.]